MRHHPVLGERDDGGQPCNRHHTQANLANHRAIRRTVAHVVVVADHSPDERPLLPLTRNSWPSGIPVPPDI